MQAPSGEVGYDAEWWRWTREGRPRPHAPDEVVEMLSSYAELGIQHATLFMSNPHEIDRLELTPAVPTHGRHSADARSRAVCLEAAA